MTKSLAGPRHALSIDTSYHQQIVAGFYMVKLAVVAKLNFIYQNDLIYLFIYL